MPLPAWNALTAFGQREALRRARLLTHAAIDGTIVMDEREECGELHALPADDPRAVAVEAVYTAHAALAP